MNLFLSFLLSPSKLNSKSVYAIYIIRNHMTRLPKAITNTKAFGKNLSSKALWSGGCYKSRHLNIYNVDGLEARACFIHPQTSIGT